MSNVPKLRSSFSADIADLSRLRQAIDRDILRDEDWRRKVLGELDAVIRSLMTAPERTYE